MIRPRAARSHVDTFTAYLKERLPHHRRDTLRRVAEVLFGVIQAESTLHRKIALHIDREASQASITRMVARTFHETRLTPQDVTDVLLPLLPTGKLTLVVDRTNWKLGAADLNLLVLGVALGGVVLPLNWKVLPHGGSSEMRARMFLVGQLLQRLPARRWAVLIADREFVGQEWFTFLRKQGLKRCIRIRESTLLDDRPARDHFQDLQSGEVRGVFDGAWVYGSWMQVVATLSPQGERVLVASDLSLWDTLSTYRLRWGIECTFALRRDEDPGLEPRTDPHDSAGSTLPSVRLPQLSAGLDGPDRHLACGTAEHPQEKHGRPAWSRARYGGEALGRALRWGKSSFHTSTLR